MQRKALIVSATHRDPQLPQLHGGILRTIENREKTQAPPALCLTGTIQPYILLKQAKGQTEVGRRKGRENIYMACPRFHQAVCAVQRGAHWQPGNCW